MLKFVKQFIKTPRNVGNILPSSRKLAEAVAQTASEHFKPEHQVIEIGPGTGIITKQLKSKLDSKHTIHLVENNSAFFEILKETFPKEKIYARGFETVNEIWNTAQPKLIISSLPWLSLPQDVVDAGLKILANELIQHQDSILIQYTYGLIDPIPFNEPEILDIPAHFIFLNFPPARIWLYKKKPTKK